ncbi:hypothetical protein [Haliangium ochraceum]|uniref:Uncharacterized protein n=1 Tax=Haliangium ochraceum (strain DSM 14365 / JCM 11303 / SMP-2) TaxID=502025 RepID=D0LLM5_HALO1|nr:hypothetical protein [Haliangium ochraceum]ACY13242.1 hypothetical protein Hoch_0605 [Haliangium ochraceum DSM 14365]
MGWLEQLAQERGHKSLRALAYAMKKDPSWPAARKPESVANNLRDLDKGKNAQWWAGTGRDLLPALAAALGEDESDLVARIQHPPTKVEPGVNLWSFQMFPALRPLDLAQEAPFPGVPEELTRPGGPREPRTWWHAPAGAGKSLVGRWLEARFGWTFLEAGRWSDIKLPQQGRVFVALASSDKLTQRDLEALPDDLKLCIAAPGPLPKAASSSDSQPQQETAEQETAEQETAEQETAEQETAEQKTAEQKTTEQETANFAECATPPPKSWAAALIDWVASRVRSGGGFDLVRVRQWLEDAKLLNSFATPGSLLSFLGLVDEIGLDAISGEHAGLDRRWLRVWLKAAVERKRRDLSQSTRHLLAKQGDELLLAMECARLRAGHPRALSEKAWAALVPTALAPPVNADDIYQIIETTGDDLRERLRDELKPDGRSVVRALRALGALEEAAPDTFVLAPPWAASIVLGEAAEQLWEDVPAGLGALLLHPETCELVLHALIDEVSGNDFAHIERCVAAPATTPEHMAAVDAAFRAVGLALLEDTDIPTKLIRMLWDRQMACTRKRYPDYPPLPMLMLDASADRATILGQGAWILAALSLSLALSLPLGLGDGDEHPVDTSVLPWLNTSSDELHREIAAAVHDIPSFERNEIVGSFAYRLGAKLLQRFGVLRFHDRLCKLQEPDIVVGLSQGDPHDLHHNEKLLLLRLTTFGLAALEGACNRQGCALDDVLAWCWQTWSWVRMYSYPPYTWGPDGGWGQGSADDLARIWRAAPADELQDEFFEREIPRKFWPLLTPAMWKRWIDIWSKKEHPWGGDAEAAFAYIPEDLALAAVRDGFVDGFCHEIRRILWQRIPDDLLALIDELAHTAPAPCDSAPQQTDRRLLDLAYSVPDEYARQLIEHATCWCRVPDAYPGVGDWLEPWLIRLIERRVPGWRDAFALVRDGASLRGPAARA